MSGTCKRDYPTSSGELSILRSLQLSKLFVIICHRVLRLLYFYCPNCDRLGTLESPGSKRCVEKVYRFMIAKAVFYCKGIICSEIGGFLLIMKQEKGKGPTDAGC
jgi:hypothetical protein